MQITDLHGNAIEITDLTKAIRQAEDFAGYRHADKSLSKLDEQLHNYWSDIHAKLLQLQSDTSTN